MFKLFSLPTLLLASLAIGVFASTPLGDNGCIICTQEIPECHCSVYESCIIILSATCFECAHAVCLPPRKDTTDAEGSKSAK
ncbi:hypothetical protein B0H14DRAFT_3483705 [Mycena olivaceomarginata]|nr:hypothetical protein B0H14DRAFT_3483705 [Mycena olivaceomarginata]